MPIFSAVAAGRRWKNGLGMVAEEILLGISMKHMQPPRGDSIEMEAFISTYKLTTCYFSVPNYKQLWLY